MFQRNKKGEKSFCFCLPFVFFESPICRMNSISSRGRRPFLLEFVSPLGIWRVFPLSQCALLFSRGISLNIDEMLQANEACKKAKFVPRMLLSREKPNKHSQRTWFSFCLSILHFAGKEPASQPANLVIDRCRSGRWLLVQEVHSARARVVCSQ
jgi:hypothetical protein